MSNTQILLPIKENILSQTFIDNRGFYLKCDRQQKTLTIYKILTKSVYNVFKGNYFDNNKCFIKKLIENKIFLYQIPIDN